MSTLSKNIAYNLLGQTLALILSFVATRYIFRQLGEDALGIIYFSLTMSSVLFAVLEMGICSTAVREVAAHFRDDPRYIRDLIRTTSMFYWTAYILLVLAVYLGAPLLVEKWITLKSMEQHTAIRLVQILGMGGLTVLPRSLYGSFLRGLQRMEFNNAIDVFSAGLQQFGTIVLLATGRSLFHIAYWITACNVLGLLAYMFVSGRFLSMLTLIPGYVSGVVRRNIEYSARVMSISMLSLAHTQADKVALSKLLPVSTLGVYGFISGLTARPSILAEAIAQAAFPSFAALFKGNHPAHLMKQYWKLQDLVCLATVPVFAAIVFYANPLLAFVFGSEIARTLLPPITFLCVGFYMHGSLTVPYFFSLAAGRPDISSRANFLALFVTVPATFVLVRFFGLTGAGLSWIFYHVFMYVVAMPKICSECLHISARGWYEHIGRIVGVAVVTYGLVWGLLSALGTARLVPLTLAYLGATLAFVFAAYWLMGDDLRGTLARWFRVAGVKASEPV